MPFGEWGATAAENVWVNADLPKCDRDAKLLSRRAQPNSSESVKERRSKRDPNKAKDPKFVSAVKPQALETPPDSKMEAAPEKEMVKEETEDEVKVVKDTLEDINNNEISNGSQGSKNEK